LALPLKEQRALHVLEYSSEGATWPSERARSMDGERCILKCFTILTTPSVLLVLVDELDENELARAHDKYGGKVQAGFWCET